MTLSAQLSLPVQLPDDETFVSFYPGDNQPLLSALRHMALDSGERMLYLWGSPSSGRTHLLHACCSEFADRDQACAYLPLEHPMMSPAMLEGLENMSLVALDNIDAVAGNAQWEEAIFDFYNRRKEGRDNTTRLIVTASQSAQQLPLSLPDLQSRLNWGLTYRVHELDDEQKLSALQLRAQLRGLKMPLDVARFLLKRLSRDMTTLLHNLDVLDKASMTAQRKLTVPFVKEILKL